MQIPNIMFEETPSSRHAAGKDRQTDMTKVIGAFRDYANASKNVTSSTSIRHVSDDEDKLLQMETKTEHVLVCNGSHAACAVTHTAARYIELETGHIHCRELRELRDLMFLQS
jgi:hypothetical protein